MWDQAPGWTQFRRWFVVDNKQIESCLVEAGLVREGDTVLPDESLFDRGIIDSLGIMTVASHLENRFDINVREEDLLPSNFDSINSIARYVNGVLGSPTRSRG